MSDWLFVDTFCKAGGAAVGYDRAFRAAGLDVHILGVDKEPQPHYPFAFVQDDALDFLAKLVEHHASPPLIGVHASPPCQAYSDLAKRNGNAHEHPQLVEPVRELLVAAREKWGVEWIIENVEGAPLIDPVVLCGASFKGLRVIRHRLFETSFFVPRLPHVARHPLCYTRDKRKAHYGQLDEWTAFVTVTGGGNCSKASALDAMGIDWHMTKEEVNEAIPPAMTEHVGRALAAAVRMRRRRRACV